MRKEFNIGQLINEKLRESGHTVTWFAKKMNCDRTNIYKIFRKSNLDILLLGQISNVLNYDFLSHSADVLVNDNKSVDNPATDM